MIVGTEVTSTLKASLVLIINVVLIGCGSGGEGTGLDGEDLTVSSGCGDVSIQSIEVNSRLNSLIHHEETQCVRFLASEHTTYQVVVESDTGFVASAAHRNGDLSDSSVIAYNIDPLNSAEGVVFTAESSGNYYIELYGVESSQYNLELRTIDVSDYISVSEKSPAISAISSYQLPLKQTLLQPAINSKIISLSNRQGDTLFIDVSFINSQVAPNWLTFNETQNTGDSISYEYSITRTDIPAGDYEEPVKLTQRYGSHIHVYQVVNLGYFLSERPFSISSSHTQSVVGGIYSFDITSNSLQDLDFNIEYAPNGMTVDLNGHVNWLAKMPMFTDAMDINWGIRATLNNVSILLEDYTTLSNATFVEPITRTGLTFSEFSYDGNMVSSDLDQDGKTEIVLSDMDKVLYSIEYDTGEYREDWVNSYAISDTQKINTLAITDLNRDGVDELVIGMWQVEDTSYTGNYSSLLVLMDGVTKKVIKSINVDVERIRSIKSSDLDGDGKNELVVYGTIGSSIRLRIYEGIDLALEWMSQDLQLRSGSSAIRLGNVDNDASVEIVTGTGYVIDGTNYDIESLGSLELAGTTMEVGDADNDGVDDIIFASRLRLVVYDGVDLTEKYHIDKALQYDGSFDDLLVSDITGTGKNHLVTSSNKFGGEIVIYLFNDLTMEFDVDRIVESVQVSHSSGINALLVDDFDNDGFSELLWREGGLTTANDGLTIAGFQAGPQAADIEWYTDNPSEYSFNGFFTPHYIKYPTGEDNIWFISNDSQDIDSDNTINRGPRLLKLDLSTSQLSVTDPVYTGGAPVYSTSCGYYSKFIALDVNADNVKDAVIAPCQTTKPAMTYDLYADSDILSSTLSFNHNGSGESRAMDFGDFGNDSRVEVAVVTQYGDVYVYDHLTNSMIWEYDFGSNVLGRNIKVADIDNNGSLDLVVAMYDKVFIFNYDSLNSTFVLKNEASFDNISDILIADLDGDGAHEIGLVHEKDLFRYLSIYDKDFNLIARNRIDYYVTSMFLEDLSGDRKNILLSSEEFLGYGVSRYETNKLRAIDPYSGGMIWQSPNLLGRIPINSLKYSNVDVDADIELFFTTNKTIKVIH